jgi:hypothetical protein
MNAFDDVSYPLALGLDAKISPAFSTSIATTASGFEHRNSLWAMRGSASMWAPACVRTATWAC